MSSRGSTAQSKQIWVDGRQVHELEVSPVPSGPAIGRRCGSGRPGRRASPRRLLDADIAMPAIYGKALSPVEIAARFATGGLSRPTGPWLLGLLAAR